MDIFNDAGKHIEIVEGQAVLPGYVAIPASTNGPAVNDSVLITSCNFDSQSNYTLNQSLDQLTYLYSFGNVPPTVTISGILMSQGSCEAPPSPSTVQDLYQFYLNNSVSGGQNKTPIVYLDLSGLALQGLLVALNMTIQDPSQRIWSWRMTLRTSIGAR